jgi:hypothetical protein
MLQILRPKFGAQAYCANLKKQQFSVPVFPAFTKGRLRRQGIRSRFRVKVPRIGAVSVRPYAKRTPIAYDDVDSSTLEIVLNQQDYWALRAEDIEKLQALADKTDKHVAGVLKAGAGVTEDLGTTVAPISIRSGVASGCASAPKTADSRQSSYRCQ